MRITRRPIDPTEQNISNYFKNEFRKIFGEQNWTCGVSRVSRVVIGTSPPSFS